MADERIEIEITLDDGEVKRGFARIEKESKKAGDSVNNSLGKSFLSLKTAILAAGAAITAVFAKRAVDAAARQEQAVNALNTSLKLAGTFSEETSRSIQDFASSLQEVTTVGDETTLELVALSQNFTSTAEEAQKLTKAAIELSAATGLSLESSVKNLGKTFGGLTGELGESLPQLRNVSKEALKTGAALDFVLDRFGGAAAARVRTFEGATQQLSNSFGDLLEKFGDFIVKNPVIIKLINDISASFIALGKRISAFAESGGFTTITIAILSIGKAVNFVVTGPLEVLFNTVKALFLSVQTGAQTLVVGLLEIANTVVKFLPDGNKFKESFNAFRSVAKETLVEFANDSATATAGILSDFEVTNEVDEYINNLLRAATATEDANNKIVNSANGAANKVKEVFEITNEAINKALGKSLASGIQGAVKSLSKGENAFEGFAKTALASFGGFLVELGQGAILVGIAADAVKKAVFKLQGPAAIAAGVALVALGSAFQSLGAESSSAPQQGADTGATPVTSAEFDQDQLVDEVEQQKATEVNIDITGQVVDPRGTALQIAELLRDIGDSNGAILVNT